MQVILSNTGQITIPELILKQLHLQPGDAVELVLSDAGEIRLLPVTALITKLKGMLSATRKILTLEAMQEVIASGAAES
ncbi:AbrB/MazE/SpoVT family DNA-binding domain-containing protein [Methylomonas paludis]|uniref:AbrB/MazE/SpoVT family DNA-binding domain-containing protein n=1 Tax=Methylomonas paludis TaxID=1173101 RepID=A0A975R9U6_9GAMM|nr:AbrB/MazE/SpoVT family DNA-binding domain-containing protein [Methylomonas paludis]QWF70609.1 AbrB/MazE/SpoVT family DNA-binding domain-containing protein [Methylomonas paludis]